MIIINMSLALVVLQAIWWVPSAKEHLKPYHSSYITIGTLPEGKISGIGGVKLVKVVQRSNQRKSNHPSHLAILDTRLDNFVPTNGEVFLSKY